MLHEKRDNVNKKIHFLKTANALSPNVNLSHDSDNELQRLKYNKRINSKGELRIHNPNGPGGNYSGL